MASGHQFLCLEAHQSPVVFHCPFIAGTLSMFGILTFLSHPFNSKFSTSREWFRRIGMRPRGSPTQMFLHVSHTARSSKLCLAVTEVNRGDCVTCLVTFVPPAGDCVLLKQTSVLFGAVLCFCWWNFVSAWNQIGAFNCRCIPMFVTVLLVPTNPEHRDHRIV